MMKYERRRGVAVLCVPIIVAVLLYWPTLQLPLMYDTLLHIRIADELTILEALRPVEAFGFYRPTTFLPLIVIKKLFGGYPAVLLHGLNVVKHGINAGLVAWLVLRLRGQNGQALCAGLLFASFPFSYQAVAVYGHTVHPLITMLMLIGIHAFLSGRWLILFGAFFVGILSHESAVLLGVFTLIIFLTQRREGTKVFTTEAHSFWVSVGLIVLGGLYVVGYQFLDMSRAPSGGDGRWGLKALYMMQDLAHPVVWLGRFLPIDGRIVVIVGFILLLLLLVNVRRRIMVNDDPAAIGLGIWLFASVLIAVPLSADYLLNGARLLYLGSVGVAMVWVGILPQNRWSIRLCLVIVMVNIAFVRERLDDYAMLAETVRTVERDGTPEQSVVIVNLPQWIARENTYPIGSEFVAQLGEHLFVEEWTDFNGLPNQSVIATWQDELLSDVPYSYGLHKQTAWDEIFPPHKFPSLRGGLGGGFDLFIMRFDEARLEKVGSVVPAFMDDVVAIVGESVLHEVAAIGCDGVVTVRTVWTVAESREPTTVMFAQALNGDGVLVGQVDRPLLSLRPDLLPSLTDYHIIDERQIDTDIDIDIDIRSDADILFGLYDFVTGERKTVTSPTGRVADNGIRVPVNWCD